MYILLALFALSLLALNIFATWILINSSLATKKQKVVQLLLTWMLPLFGLFVLSVHNNKKSNYHRNFKNNDSPGNKAYFHHDNNGNFASASSADSDTWSGGGGESSGGGDSGDW